MAVKRTITKEAVLPEPVVAPVVSAPVVGERTILEKASPAMALVIVVMAFFLGSLWSKNQYLEQQLSGGVGGPTTAGAQQQAQAQAQADTAAQPSLTMQQVKDLWSKDVLKFGDANKKLLVVEIADPSCPFCHVAGGKNPELNRQMDPQTNRFQLVTDGGSYVAPVVEIKKLVDSGKASMVYIYQNGHGNGELAMKALYCANEKGRFWAVDDLLMSNAGYNMINNEVKNDKANSGKLATFLAKAVDQSFMKGCLESGKYDNRIAEDQKLAMSIGARGTPGFFVNTTFYNGAYSWNDMKAVADAALK
jgi:protein-disulfide isomerase